MNLPSTFTTHAVIDGAVRRIVVDLKAGEISGLALCSRAGTGETRILRGAPCEEAARAWALKSLAWLKAEADKATKEDLAIRDAVAKVRAANEALSAMGGGWQNYAKPNRTTLQLRAWEEYRAIRDPDELEENLREAYTADLLVRMAAEMERQATEAARESTTPPECDCSHVTRALAKPGSHLASCPAAAPNRWNRHV